MDGSGIDTRLKVNRISSGQSWLYSVPDLKKSNLRFAEIGHLIREGYSIRVTTPEGFDFTKETLSKIALDEMIKAYKGDKLIDKLSDLVSEELLYEIIDNGNYFSWISRKARGSVL